LFQLYVSIQRPRPSTPAARIWIEARVDFRDPVNLVTAGVAKGGGIGDPLVESPAHEPDARVPT
jgi:hypothetical protein